MKRTEDDAMLSGESQTHAKTRDESEGVPCDGLLMLHTYKEDILNSLECGLMVIDLDGMVVLFNRAAGEITGEDPEKVLFSRPEMHTALRSFTNLAKDSFNKPVRRQEVVIETRTAGKKTIGVSTYLMRHGGEGVMGVIAVFSDLTGVKDCERRPGDPSRAGKEEEMATGTYHPRSENRPGGGEPGRRPVILVADGDPTVRDFYLDILEKAGCKVLLAQDGQEAMWKAAHESIDLLVLDVDIPRLDGVEVAQRLSTANPDLPIVCTGPADGQNGHVLIYPNVVAYLPKPVSIFELKRTVAGALAEAAEKQGILMGDH